MQYDKPSDDARLVEFYLFSLSANRKHYSNTVVSIKIINEIVLPYFECQMKSVGLDENFRALLILDVFCGQMTNEVIKLLKEKNIFFVKVPNNMIHLLQPLDLSVNCWVQRWMRQQFFDWYAEQIRLNLDEGKT